MQGNRIIKPANKQSGFSLVELMIAIVLGLLITAAVTAMTVNSLKMSGNTLKSARLNQDLGAVMQIMVNEIRRAGYTAGTVSYTNGEDVAIGVVDASNPPDGGDCVLYKYNQDPARDEDFGFRRIVVNNIGVLQMADNTGAVACDDADGNWVRVTDPEIINVTEFSLNTVGSKCHNIDEVVSVRIAPGVSATEFACNEPTKTNLQQWGVDDDGNPGWVDVEDSITLPLKALEINPDDDDEFNDDITSVGARHVNISLRGVFNDPFVEADSAYDEYPIKKSLDVSIKVRNDHVYKVDEI